MRLKILCHEIMMLRPVPVCKCNPTSSCTCDVMKTVVQNVNEKHVIKFDKGLSDSFKLVRSRIW